MTAEEALRWHRMNHQAFLETQWDGKVDNPFDDAFCEALAALEREAADGCEGCKYRDKDAFEMPCLQCKRNKKDYWKAQK